MISFLRNLILENVQSRSEKCLGVYLYPLHSITGCIFRDNKNIVWTFAVTIADIDVLLSSTQEEK